jgi:hypothetical protein
MGATGPARAALAYWATAATATSLGACFREAPGDRAAQSPVRLAVAGNVAQFAVGISHGLAAEAGGAASQDHERTSLRSRLSQGFLPPNAAPVVPGRL